MFAYAVVFSFKKLDHKEFLERTGKLVQVLLTEVHQHKGGDLLR